MLVGAEKNFDLRELISGCATSNYIQTSTGGFLVSRISPLSALLLSLFLLASACGSGDGADVTSAADPASSQPADDNGSDVENSGLPDGPIPVETDGGIGDGAEPLAGAEEPEETGTWHGSEVAETNCPGTEWTRVQASAFSFSVPSGFVDDEVQGIDSEVGQWSSGDGIQVSYDFGWYSYSLAQAAGAEVEDVDYSGIVGQFAVVRAAETSAETNSVGVYFPEVTFVNETWDKLGLIINHDDPNDEIIGRCIARSVTFG